MIPVSEYFRSVEHIWVIWLVSLVLLVWLTRKILGGIPWRDWKNLLRKEDGAAYSLSYVMTFPFFLLLVCLVVETTLFLVVKMGTVYAAYAGARAHIVWRTTPVKEADVNNHVGMNAEAYRKTQQAVISAMGAFASSNQLHLQGAGITGPASAAARRHYQAYKKYSDGDAAAGYIVAKYRFAARATQVAIAPTNPGPEEDITVTVTYDMPINIPGLGRILGERAPWPGARFYTYRIVSKISLQNEAPRNDQQTLGIGYVSKPLYLDNLP